MLNSAKIFGAGSIGNHLAYASRRLGLSVNICDIDQSALDRTKSDIYPMRYGEWDSEIGLHLVESAPKGGHDLIVVGTPPDSHMSVSLNALEEKPKVLLIEKPLATPDLSGLVELEQRANELGIAVYVGYDHAVSSAISKLEEIINSANIGQLITLDVEFREHWHGIFSAHPWLDGPKDTYLGYWQRGGGACSEHSHAINLWQHLSDITNNGRIHRVSAELGYIDDGVCNYDRVCLLQVETENGMKGRIVQDVITFPVRKEAFLQFETGAAYWKCGGDPKGDIVSISPFSENLEAIVIEKTRPDDFITELNHIFTHLKSNQTSPISLQRGIETMMVIAAAHLSAQNGRSVTIDYQKGPIQSALNLI